MTTEKVTIKNRLGLNLMVQIDARGDATKLAFVAHGQKGSKDQPHITAFAEAFLKNDYRVVRFDGTHAAGESDGDVIDVTYDSYVHDLEDVIDWARQQKWFQSPFALCGHSMGAQSTAWYAEHHPDEISLLAPMAPVINYSLHITTMPPDEVIAWKDRGYSESASKSRPGVVFKIGWQCEESLKRFDLLPGASNLTMPILNIVGEKDQPCPVAHQKIFMDAAASSSKQLVVMPGLEHSYRTYTTDEYDGDQLQQVTSSISDWLKDHA